MRFTEHNLGNEAPKQEKKERTLPKPGEYGREHLEKSKKRPFKGGR